jgi:hypothetical protein
MTTELTITTEGIRESLAALRRVDPKLQTQARAELRSAGSRLVSRPKSEYPLQAPLSEWRKDGRLGYVSSKAKSGVRIVVGGRTRNGVAPLITMVQSNAAAAQYDIAGLRQGASGKGTPQGLAFIRNLNAKYGEAQRGLWRSRKWIYDNAERELRAALDKVEDDANRALSAGVPGGKS